MTNTMFIPERDESKDTIELMTITQRVSSYSFNYGLVKGNPLDNLYSLVQRLEDEILGLQIIINESNSSLDEMMSYFQSLSDSADRFGTIASRSYHRLADIKLCAIEKREILKNNFPQPKRGRCTSVGDLFGDFVNQDKQQGYSELSGDRR